MKKMIIVLAALTLMFTMAGCRATTDIQADGGIDTPEMADNTADGDVTHNGSEDGTIDGNSGKKDSAANDAAANDAAGRDTAKTDESAGNSATGKTEQQLLDDLERKEGQNSTNNNAKTADSKNGSDSAA